MNETKECPVCLGDGELLICDFIDHALRERRPVQCPLCLGSGRLQEAKFLIPELPL
jgi:hypothetical protein